MGSLLHIFTSQRGADIGRNGNSVVPDVRDRTDLAVAFLDHLLDAWDLFCEARQRRQEAGAAADEADADKKN
jgi:hypothetical protein